MPRSDDRGVVGELLEPLERRFVDVHGAGAVGHQHHHKPGLAVPRCATNCLADRTCPLFVSVGRRREAATVGVRDVRFREEARCRPVPHRVAQPVVLCNGVWSRYLRRSGQLAACSTVVSPRPMSRKG